MIYDMSGKTAVVTGASRGLGEATARTLAACGARVALVARSKSALAAIAAELPHDPVVIEADMGSEDGWRTVADQALASLGAVDILVNNAGVSAAERMGKMSEAALDQTLSVNVRNLILLTDALTESLKAQKGAVVNISSVSAFGGSVGQVAYATSKGAVNALTRNLSLDLGRDGVRVNAVAPGLIDDGMWKTGFESGKIDREETMAKMRRILPLEGRWGAAQDVANAVAFLASDKAGYITGQVLRVDGGLIA